MNKIVYVGAVELSYVGLDELLRRGVRPELIVTLSPDRDELHSDFVNLAPLAADHSIPVQLVHNINEPALFQRLVALKPDYIFVIGWSQLIHPKLLTLPKNGCIGFHFAKLPRNRGRAAIPWVILNQESETGVTLMQLDEGVDSGDIVAQRTIQVSVDERARTLYDKVCAGLRDMMSEIAEDLRGGRPLRRLPQNHSQATYLAKRTTEDGWINWEHSAEEIERLIRAAGKPYPGAFTIYKDRKLTIWEAQLVESFNQIGTTGQILGHAGDSVVVQCGTGWIGLTLVQGEDDREIVEAKGYFPRMHDKLGISIYQLWQQVRDKKND